MIEYHEIAAGFERLLHFYRCKESESPHAVVIYLLEPQTCQYILGVQA